MENKSEIFCWNIPAHILQADISASAKIIWGVLLGLCSNGRRCFISNAALAEAIKVDVRTVQRNLAELRDANLIITTEGARRTISVVLHEVELGDDKNVMGGMTKMSGGDDKNVTHKKNNNTKDKNYTPLPPKKELSDVIEFPPSIDTKEARQAVADFIEYRRQLKKPLTKFGLEKLISSYTGRLPSELCQDIDHSIKMGWQGVHPAKTAYGGKSKAQNSYDKSKEVVKSILMEDEA